MVEEKPRKKKTANMAVEVTATPPSGW
jgi:hypothetical protein